MASGKNSGKADRRIGGSTRRRWPSLFVAGVVLAVLAGALAVVASTLSLESNAARQEVSRRLAALTGQSVAIGGTGAFQLLPLTRLQMSDLRIGDPAAPGDATIRIDAVVADFDVWQALLGRARLKRVVLVRPEVPSASLLLPEGAPASMTESRNSPVAAAGIKGSPLAATRALGAFLSRFDDVHTVEIRDGVFRMGRPAPGLDVTNANLTISWPSPTDGAQLSGSYVWNGEPAEIDIDVAAPLDFLNGRSSALSVSLAAPPLSGRFAGSAMLGTENDVSGNLTLSTPNLSRAMRWLGDVGAEIPDLGGLSIKADVASRGNLVNLRNADVTVAGLGGKGAMELRIGGPGRRTSIGGTLAFGRFDLGALARTVTPLPETALALQRPITVGFIDDLDLDLRLSAANAAIGGLAIEDFAATLKFDSGRATIDIGDAGLLGGRGQGRLTIDTRPGIAALRGTASLAGGDTARLLDALDFGALAVTGRSDVSASFEGPIPNWAEFLQAGTIALDVGLRGGSVTGFDPKPYLAGGQRPLALGGDNAFPFRSIKARVKADGPAIQVQAFELIGNSGTLEAAGSMTALSGRVDLHGRFEPASTVAAQTVGADAQASFTTSKPIAFTMAGEWPKPIVATGAPENPR